jgi:hypothetical protein
MAVATLVGTDQLQRLGAVGGAQLLVDVREVGAHRDIGHPELLGDLPRLQALHQQGQHVTLLRGESGAVRKPTAGLVEGFAGSKFLLEAPGQPPIDGGLAGEHPMAGPRDLVGLRAL